MTEQKKRSEVENYGGMFDGDDDSWTKSHYLKQLSKSEGGPKDCCMQINRFPQSTVPVASLMTFKLNHFLTVGLPGSWFAALLWPRELYNYFLIWAGQG